MDDIKLFLKEKISICLFVGFSQLAVSFGIPIFFHLHKSLNWLTNFYKFFIFPTAMGFNCNADI